MWRWMSVTAGQRADRRPGQVLRRLRDGVWADGAPPVIAESRAELVVLIATNLLRRRRRLGQRGQYGKCGPQDAAASVWLRRHGGDGDQPLLPVRGRPASQHGGLLEQAVTFEAIDTAAANS